VFGATPSTAATGDGSGNVYQHTFARLNSAVHKTATVVVNDANDNNVYPGCGFTTFELSAAVGEELSYTVSGMGRKSEGVPTFTASYSKENPFFSGMIGVKLAADTTGFAAASDILATSFNLTIEKNLMLLYGLNSVIPHSIIVTGFTVTGSIDLDMTDTTYKDLMNNSTVKAIQIKAQNTLATIGSSSNPILEFQVNEADFTGWNPDYSQDDVVKQSIDFTGHYKAADSAQLKAYLTNTATSYSAPVS